MLDAIATAAERDHIRRILGLPMGRKLRLLIALTRDGRLTPLMFAPLIGVVGYIILPVNIIPKWFLVLRKLDNLLIGLVGLWLFVKLTPPEILDDNLAVIEGHGNP